MTAASQSAQVLEFLRTGRELSPMLALSLMGSFRLAARVAELKAAGHRIETRIVKSGAKRYAAYRLASEQKEEYASPAR